MAIQQSLKGIWEAANGNEYSPAISKDGQFTLGLVLLVLGNLIHPMRSPTIILTFIALICTGFFGMSEHAHISLMTELIAKTRR